MRKRERKKESERQREAETEGNRERVCVVTSSADLSHASSRIAYVTRPLLQDIIVDCPGGQINFHNRRVGNGVLDADSRGDAAAVENVCWQTPDVGVFTVGLKNFTEGCYSLPLML